MINVRALTFPYPKGSSFPSLLLPTYQRSLHLFSFPTAPITSYLCLLASRPARGAARAGRRTEGDEVIILGAN
ncbi:hypothetical protein E2C01_035693 [Portunus trituberculatus]|uniref:Uncharacterized protein n=1 Tax=Portunus trituberculatus TaxID=210409 RepID=A0A5B7FA07_PORTR|nr:hypothetical protein [Portunus trituberculatus]